MDTLAHTLYGLTVCSRRGLAGGRTAPTRPPWPRDSNFWLAGFFGAFPDLFSLGVPYLLHGVAGGGSFFRSVGPEVLEVYHTLHSLVVALPVCWVLRRWRPAWFVPSLAWPLHIVMDMFTHGAGGRFQTRIFHPVSDWGFPGWNWWQHPELVWGIWLTLPALWIGLLRVRRRRA